MSIIITFLAVLACNFITLGILYLAGRRLWRLIVSYAVGYFAGTPENPSQFNALLDIISKKFAAAITASIKANILALKSASVREDNALAGAIVQDAAGGMPVIGALLAAYPKTAKIINKNPELVQLVMAQLAKAGRPANDNGHNVTASGNVLDINNF